MDNYLTGEDIDGLLTDFAVMKFHLSQVQGKSEDDAFSEAIFIFAKHRKELQGLTADAESVKDIVKTLANTLGEKIFGEQEWQGKWASWMTEANPESNATEVSQSALAPCVACGSPVDFFQGNPNQVFLQRPGEEGDGYSFTLNIAVCCNNQACVEKAWEIAKTCYVDGFDYG